MADIFSTLKRGNKELAQESAKTDNMCKGGATGIGGGDTSLFSKLKGHGNREIAVEQAKTDGMCKS